MFIILLFNSWLTVHLNWYKAPSYTSTPIQEENKKRKERVVLRIPHQEPDNQSVLLSATRAADWVQPLKHTFFLL